MLEKIDNYLIGIATKISHWTQKHFGITNFCIARIGGYVELLGIMICIILCLWNRKAYEIALFLLIGVPFLAVVTHVAITDIKATHKSEQQMMENNISIRKYWYSDAILRVIGFMLTLTGMLLLPITIFVTRGFLPLFSVFIILAGSTILDIFAEVTPLPPHKSKMREWAEKLKAALQPTPILTPVPVQN